MRHGRGDSTDLLRAMAATLRRWIVEQSFASGVGHIGSALSVVDVVAALWGAVMRQPGTRLPDRDRFILSKGHAATALYAALAYRGFFPESVLDTFAEPGSCLGETPSPGCIPGLELATGSLGHGLPVGIGMAFAGRVQGLAYRVFVLMSDGECNEGSAWEAALLAPAQRLERVTTIIDYNKWQATGRSDEIMALRPLKAKWDAFGWSSYEIDGHDLRALINAMGNVPDGTGRPVAIVAHTVKGKGVSFMEDDNNWHYRAPSADELRRAKEELGLA